MIEPVFVTPRPVYHNQHFCKLFRESYFRVSFTLTEQLVRRFLLLHPMMVMESWAAIFVQTHPNAHFGLPALSSLPARSIVRSSERLEGRGDPASARPCSLSLARLVHHSFNVPLSAFSILAPTGGEAGKALHPVHELSYASKAITPLEVYPSQSNHFTGSVSLLQQSKLAKSVPQMFR